MHDPKETTHVIYHANCPDGFAIYYFDRTDGARQFGLRSRNGFDVSVIAKQFGGGGHPAAAGFQMKAGELP